MARCANCNAELQPQWKFCIFCGTPVDPSRAPHPTVPGATRAAHPTVPGAIRPEAAPEERPRRRLDIPLILGIALGIGGLILIAYLIVTFG